MLPQKFYATVVMLVFLMPWQETGLESRRPVSQYSQKDAGTYASKDLETIRERVIEDLLEPPIQEARIKSLLASIKSDGSWPEIDYKDVSRTGFRHSSHLDNMFELARAYKKPGSPWYQNPVTKEVTLSALDFWLQHDFISDNWWWNEMGTPARMINTLLVIDTDLNENQIREALRIAGRANLEASGARPGGDLIQIAAMLGKQALFRRDETVLERVVSVMSDEIKVTTGRGLQPDMSFHHRVDNVICTLSYGLGYANAYAYWALKISGTKYMFPEDATRLLIDYYLDGICKSMVHGRFPDPGAKNRDLSRKGTLNPASATTAENLLRISNYRRGELEQIVKIRKGEEPPQLTWDRFFWQSEYFTHQRPGYFASVRMHSSRNHTMEQPHNEEGLKMHHVGDGSNFISLTGKEYLDIFPVWDWQKIPGATIVQKPVHPHWNEIARKGLTDFVGGVSDGKYGAAAFDFKSAHDPLSARKAWFFFDNEYVCLGADIRAEAEFPVVTTLNQCLLKGDVVVRSKKDNIIPATGTHDFPHVSWVFHDGVGYVFPEPRKVKLSNAMATGKWKDINHQASASGEQVEREVFTLWLDHGVKPEQATYEYIVVPGAETALLEDYSKNSPIEILSNTPQIQAVVHKGINLGHVVFYEAGKIKINDHITLSTDNPCMVMVKVNEKNIEAVSVSDPSRKLNTLQLKTTAFVEGTGPGWEATWDKKEKLSTITIALPQEGNAGKSVVFTTLGM